MYGPTYMWKHQVVVDGWDSKYGELGVKNSELSLLGVAAVLDKRNTEGCSVHDDLRFSGEEKLLDVKQASHAQCIDTESFEWGLALISTLH